MADTYLLEVTRQPDALNLEPGGSGTITYIVTNRTGQDDHVRVKRPDLPAGSPLTLELQGEEQQRVADGGTATFTLKVGISPTAQPGEHLVALSFIASRMEEKAFSAPVANVTIPAPKPVVVKTTGETSKKTWWIVLAAAAAILLVAGIAIGGGLLSSQGTGEKCKDISDCKGGHSCATANGLEPSDQNPRLCLKIDQLACTDNAECEHAYCRKAKAPAPADGKPATPASEAGKCGSRSPAGGACDVAEDCSASAGSAVASCTSGKCTFAEKTPCEIDAACETGLCGVQGDQPQKVCLALPAVTEACTKDGRCGPGLSCAASDKGSACLVPDGDECFGDLMCASAFCLNKRCVKSPALGAACSNGRCGMGMSCDRGLCLQPGGSPCENDGECASRRCIAGACNNPGGLRDTCTSDAQCSGGLSCPNKTCLRTIDAACGADDECGSGLCTVGKCQTPRLAGESCGPNSRCGGCFNCTNNVCVVTRLCYVLSSTDLQYSGATKLPAELRMEQLH